MTGWWAVNVTEPGAYEVVPLTPERQFEESPVAGDGVFQVTVAEGTARFGTPDVMTRTPVGGPSESVELPQLRPCGRTRWQSLSGPGEPGVIRRGKFVFSVDRPGPLAIAAHTARWGGGTRGAYFVSVRRVGPASEGRPRDDTPGSGGRPATAPPTASPAGSR